MKNLNSVSTYFGFSLRLVYFLGVLSTFVLAEVSTAANNVSSKRWLQLNNFQ